MLRTRLLLYLLPFVVLLLATGVYAIVLFSRLAASVDTAVAEHYRSVVAAQEMGLALAGIDRDAWTIATTRSPDGKFPAERLRRFEQNLAFQLQSVSSPGEQELNRQLAANYEALRQDLARLASPGSTGDKHQLYDEEIVPRGLQIKVLLDKILNLNQKAILATSQHVQAITREATRLMIAGMVIVLLISTYVAFEFSRGVLRPIQMVTSATRELADGRLSQPVPVLSRDELGELARAFNKMAAQLQEYRQSTSAELVRVHRTMEATLASFPDPIFVLNQDSQIELKNPAAEGLMSGLRLNGQLPARLQATAQKTLASGEHFLPNSFNEVVCYRVGGADKYFLPRILTMRDKRDVLFGVAVVLYDVTRFRLLDAAKSDLVATVSHELKTPLTSVRMALHILLENTVGTLNPRQEELLQAARVDCERLLRILNDLLDLARLEGGNAELHREQVAPLDLLTVAVAEVSDKAAAKALKLDYAAAPDLAPVWVDRQRIRHVFTNLLTNAIKHSPVGGKVQLRAERTADHAIQFSVADEGPGIPEEYHSRIFERFFRVPGPAPKGAGLGLSIAKEIAVAHGGWLGVRSAPGHGAIFYLVLRPGEAG